MKRKTSTKIALLISTCLLSGHVFAAEVATNAALMQAMDKVTGRVNKVIVPVNSKVAYGDFSLVLRSCKKRPAEETPENFAFIDVTDRSFGSDEYNIFRGWILSSTPGMNAIEHPIYDMWLLECINTDVDEKALLSETELAVRDKLPTKQTMQAGNVSEEKNNNIEKETPKVIRIREFINEERDIEKNISKTPAYISETTAAYVSDIEEGDEPENLLQFTKMQESSSEPEIKNIPEVDDTVDELSKALDAEILGLQNH